MSRLRYRIGRLEERLGACPSCRDRRTLVQMVTPDGRRFPSSEGDAVPCPDCGQAQELISVLLSFDSPAFPGYAGESRDAPAASARSPRPHERLAARARAFQRQR